MAKTFIIGEAGVNHNGNFDLAIQLVDIAVAAGLDAIKFQTWKTEHLLTKGVAKAAYQIATTGAEESQFEMIKKLELPYSDFVKIKAYCDTRNITFLSTAADIESLDFLMGLGMEVFKLSSSDLTNYPYLKHLARFNKEVILSTGMATMQEILDSVKVLVMHGTDKDKISILHCNTEYPTAMEDVNLLAMNTIRMELEQAKVGYSDHTMGIEVAIAAVALGAQIIEKHFTIDRDMEGPDHKASVEAGELKKMVQAIRNIEIALSGTGKKEPTQSEQKNIPIARKSIVAKIRIEKGEAFTMDNLTVKRPGTGISPMKWESILGKVADIDFEADDLITVN